MPFPRKSEMINKNIIVTQLFTSFETKQHLSPHINSPSTQWSDAVTESWGYPWRTTGHAHLTSNLAMHAERVLLVRETMPSRSPCGPEVRASDL